MRTNLNCFLFKKMKPRSISLGLFKMSNETEFMAVQNWEAVWFCKSIVTGLVNKVLADGLYVHVSKFLMLHFAPPTCKFYEPEWYYFTIHKNLNFKTIPAADLHVRTLSITLAKLHDLLSFRMTRAFMSMNTSRHPSNACWRDWV